MFASTQKQLKGSKEDNMEAIVDTQKFEMPSVLALKAQQRIDDDDFDYDGGADLALPSGVAINTPLEKPANMQTPIH